MVSTPFGEINLSQVAGVIDQVATTVIAHHDLPFDMVAGLVEIIVWRALHGQSAEQITTYLRIDATWHVTDEFVAWVITEAGRILRADAADGRSPR